MYARTFFENMNFDSVTVAPYMGSDSVQPFLEFKDKWAIVLALTSNAGGLDLLTQDAAKALPKVQNGPKLKQHHVCGSATRANATRNPFHSTQQFFIGTVGAQRSLKEVAQNGLNHQCVC